RRPGCVRESTRAHARSFRAAQPVAEDRIPSEVRLPLRGEERDRGLRHARGLDRERVVGDARDAGRRELRALRVERSRASVAGRADPAARTRPARAVAAAEGNPRTGELLDAHVVDEPAEAAVLEVIAGPELEAHLHGVPGVLREVEDLR